MWNWSWYFQSTIPLEIGVQLACSSYHFKDETSTFQSNSKFLRYRRLKTPFIFTWPSLRLGDRYTSAELVLSSLSLYVFHFRIDISCIIIFLRKHFMYQIWEPIQNTDSCWGWHTYKYIAYKHYANPKSRRSIFWMCLARFYFGLANIMQSEAFYLFSEENDLSTAAAKSIDLCIWWCDIMSLSWSVIIAYLEDKKKNRWRKGMRQRSVLQPCSFDIDKRNIFNVNPIKMNEIVMPETAATRSQHAWHFHFAPLQRFTPCHLLIWSIHRWIRLHWN